MSNNNIWSNELYLQLLEASKSFNVDREIDRDIKPICWKSLSKDVDEISLLIKAGSYDIALERIFESSQHIRSKKYINQQLAPTAIAGAFASFWSSLLNQGHAVFSMSPLMSLIDSQVIEWAKKKINLPKSSLGIATNGGSISNLTALNTARNYLTGFDVWNGGKADDLFLWKSEFAHYSIERSAQVMGLSKSQLKDIPVNTGGEIDGTKLIDIFNSDKSHINGKHIFVCTFGNTYNGAFDDLSNFIPLIDLVGRENVWIHVDAAHGGSFFHHNDFKKYFKLLEYIDSFIWNPHKLFFQPIPLSFLFFRNQLIASYSSSHTSPYLSQNVEDAICFDAHSYTLECSRTSLGFKLWLTLQLHDIEEIYKIHHNIFNLSKYFVDNLSNLENFEIFSYAKNNIICFRYRDSSINTDYILEKLQTQGWSLGTVDIKNIRYIRITLMDDNLSYSDIDELINILCNPKML